MMTGNGIAIAHGWQQLVSTPPATPCLYFGFYNSNTEVGGVFNIFQVTAPDSTLISSVVNYELGTTLQAYNTNSGVFQTDYLSPIIFIWLLDSTPPLGWSGYDTNTSTSNPINLPLLSCDLSQGCFFIDEPITGYSPKYLTIDVGGTQYILDFGGSFSDVNDVFFIQQLQSIFGGGASIVSVDNGVSTFVQISNCYNQIKPVAIEFIDPFSILPPYTAVFIECTP